MAHQGFTQTEESADTRGEASGTETPIVIEEPAYEYYYWPEEDLNNFGLSTMGDGKSGSTLGQETKRRSNLEVNSYLKSKKDNDIKPENGEEGEEGEKQGADSESAQPLYIDPVEKPRAQGPSGNPIYRWKDEEGTIHITNDLGSIPLQYQKDFFESEPDETGQ